MIFFGTQGKVRDFIVINLIYLYTYWVSCSRNISNSEQFLSQSYIMDEVLTQGKRSVINGKLRQKTFANHVGTLPCAIKILKLYLAI